MQELQKLERMLRDQFPTLSLYRAEPMSRHTSFRIGGPADLFALPSSIEELRALIKELYTCGVEPVLLGNGTNLLVSDRGIRGIVIGTNHVKGIDRQENGTSLRVACGETLANTAVAARKFGLSGMEFAHGIPGTVGGALCMNAGAYGGEMCQIVRETLAVRSDGREIRIQGEDHAFGYRTSVFQKECGLYAVETILDLQPGDPEKIEERMNELMCRRKASQPLEFPSAGSTFKRPVGNYAGTLIQNAGLKGTRVGDAQVSEKHAGFIINCGKATCQDVLSLISVVQNTVMERFGVKLEPEVRLLGQF